MTKYAVTFQQKFNRETHPLHKDIDGRAFVVLEASSPEAASDKTWDTFESNWAMIYPYDDDFMRQIEDYSLHEVTL